MELARLVATWSKDPSTKCGAVIVRPDRTVCSVGFNGFPRNLPDGDDLYADREFKHSCIVHAEVNAVLTAHEPVMGYTIYIHPVIPCDRCAVMLIQAGMKRIVAPETHGTPGMGHAPFMRARQFLLQAGVDLDEV